MNTSPEEFIKFINIIPDNIKNLLYIIPLIEKSKDPAVKKGESWKDPQYKLNIEDAKNRLASGKNIALVAQGEGLIFLDIDNPDKFECPKETLEIESRSGKPHYYYINGGDVKNCDITKIVEIRADQRYVVGPGSYVPPPSDSSASGVYHVRKEIMPSTLFLKDLPEKIQSRINERQQAEKLDISLGGTWRNQYGWSLESLRKRDQKLDSLLSHVYHPSYPSASEADMATLSKLLFWGYTHGEAVEILKAFRTRDKLARTEYIALTLGKVQQNKNIADYVSPRYWNPQTGSQLLFEDIPLEEKIIGEHIDPAFFFDINRSGKIQRFVPKRLGDYIEKFNSFLATSTKSILYRYNEDKGIWTKDGEELVRSLAVRYLGELVKNNYVNEVAQLIRDRNYIAESKLGAPTNIIVLKNGVLDIFTKKLKPYSPDYHALNHLPVNYDSNAKCPKIIKFINEVAPENVDILQEWMGYHLLKDYRYQKSCMLVGSGSNGKTTFLRLLKSFLGKDNISSVNLYSLVSNRFATAELHGQLANIAPDISEDELQRTGTFKALTGGDTIRAEQKHRDPFSFENHAKLSFSTNQLPLSPDRTYAFFRRWILIQFNKQFVGTFQDPSIIKKITTPEELNGLLNWALEGLHRLLSNNRFSESETTDQIKKLYEAMSDPITAFLDKKVDLKPTGSISKDDLYAAYHKFCKEKGYTPEAKNIFTIEIKARVPSIDEHKPRVNKKRVNSWKGIVLKEKVVHPVHMVQGQKTFLIDENSSNSKKRFLHMDHVDHLDQKPDIIILVKDAKAILSANGKEMSQISFFDEIMKKGYHRMDVDRILRKCPEFRFQGLHVVLKGEVDND